MAADRGLEAILKRDRVVVAASLAFVVALAAAYTVAGVGMTMSALAMTGMAFSTPGMMMEPATWSAAYAGLVFLMWWVMMVAMMVPSAAPTMLLFARMARTEREADPPFRATLLFGSGYLAVWGIFSLIATGLQGGLEAVGLVTGMMDIASPFLAGTILIGAGLYQLTPLKDACLRHCQNPISFLLHRWQPGARGAFRMGVEHGGYCLGCCWFLMALLFVGGIMNLLWIAGLALYVGIEKLAAGRRWITTGLGAILVAAGVWTLAGGTPFA